MLKTKLLSCFISLSLLSISLGCPCDTNVILKGQIGSIQNPSALRETGSYMLVICPREEITLGWVCSSDVDHLKMSPDLGALNIPSGIRVLSPESTTEYTIEASGKCKKIDKFTVIVVTANTTLDISATLSRDVSGFFYWKAELLPQFYSPNVIVSAIRLLPDNKTPPYKEWRLSKLDTSGKQHDYAFSSSWTEIGPVELTGTWKIAPSDPTSLQPTDLPGNIHFEVRMACK